jgi:hypothetical protein
MSVLCFCFSDAPFLSAAVSMILMACGHEVRFRLQPTSYSFLTSAYVSFGVE